MYLISIYFDEETEKKLTGYIKQVAKHTGNETMIAAEIPPHITISSFYVEDERDACEIFRRIAARIFSGSITWVSLGSFPQVLFVSSIYNEYLHELSCLTEEEIMRNQNARIGKYYHPFAWVPHTTIGKRFTDEQLQVAFRVMQNCFSPFEGKVARIGLARTNPYTDIEMIVLK